MSDVMFVGAEHASKRLMRSQKLNAGSPYLGDAEPPSAQQVAAVLHALADHSLLSHMVSNEVLQMGADRSHLGPNWQMTTALGRFLQGMGDWLEFGIAVDDEPRPSVGDRESEGQQ